MSRPRAGITGLGLVTPAGPDARSSCLALRAGIACFAELEAFWVGGEEEGELMAVQGAAIPADLACAPGTQPLAAYAQRALREAVTDAGFDASKVRARLYAAHDPGHDPTHILRTLAAEPGMGKPQSVDAGRCGVIIALRDALRALADSEIDVAVVGGFDGWVSPARLAQLSRNAQLPTGDSPDGVSPGEASGFVVVESAESIAARNARVYARVAGAAVADEPSRGPDDPPLAEGLTKALRGALGSAQPRGGRKTLPTIISDHWGHNDTASEWALSATRTLGGLEGDVEHWHPADCIGDTGAASGAITVAWGAMSLFEKWIDDDEVVVWGASGNEARAAALLFPAGTD